MSTSRSRTPEPGDAPVGLNLVVLHGVASSPPDLRVLPSGQRLATLSVRVPGTGGKATSVPVAAWDPPAWLEAVEADDALVVVGTLRRRFFRDGSGATASRVEVEAVTLGRGGERRRREAAAQRATRALAGLA
jgi:single-stranded DNA-binding protein